MHLIDDAIITFNNLTNIVTGQFRHLPASPRSMHGISSPGPETVNPVLCGGGVILGNITPDRDQVSGGRFRPFELHPEPSPVPLRSISAPAPHRLTHSGRPG